MNAWLEVIKIEGNITENTGAAGSGAGGIVKVLLILAVAVVLTGVAAYYAAGLKYGVDLKNKDATIALNQEEIADLKASLAETPAPVGVATTKLVCSTCHALDQTKGFHTVNKIKLLSEAKGQTPRICTTCHGSQPHNVHQKKLSAGEMICDSCHVSPEGEYTVPEVPEGKTLVCEACHASSGEEVDMGNYVSIHIVEANKECDICHMGDPVKVHKRATEKLGTV